MMTDLPGISIQLVGVQNISRCARMAMRGGEDWYHGCPPNFRPSVHTLLQVATTWRLKFSKLD